MTPQTDKTRAEDFRNAPVFECFQEAIVNGYLRTVDKSNRRGIEYRYFIIQKPFWLRNGERKILCDDIGQQPFFACEHITPRGVRQQQLLDACRSIPEEAPFIRQSSIL